MVEGQTLGQELVAAALALEAVVRKSFKRVKAGARLAIWLSERF